MVLKDQHAGEPTGTENATASVPVDGEAAAKAPPGRAALIFEVLALLLIVALAGGLRFWDLERNGWGTAYYTAAVRSGLNSFKNAFYASADPGGHVCVDKPPVAIWVQIVSAKIFGFSKLSVLGPQALMGTLSVLIVWHLVRRHFGRWAALLAALALAIMPISIAIDRSNNTDTCLAFVLLLATWALLAATERGNIWLFLLSLFLVGVGFNTKMLAAAPVAGVCYFVYFLGAPITWRNRFGDLALATFVLVFVSLSWVVAYDLTPEENRPFVDSTRNNLMWTLVIEHNGLDRFLRRGGRGGPGGLPGGPGGGPGARPGPGGGPPPAPNDPPDPAAVPAGPADAAAPEARPQQPPGKGNPRAGARGGRAPRPADGNPGPGGGNPPAGGEAQPDQRPMPQPGDPAVAGGPPAGGPRAGGPGGAGRGPGLAGPGGPPRPGGPGGPGGGMQGSGWGGGSPVGPWRMFHPHMLGQTMWLFPLALLGLAVAWFQARLKWPLEPRHQAILTWTGCFVLYCGFYSFTGGIFHDYYVVTMAAPMAAMTGIGAVGLWRAFHNGGWASIFLPVALLVTALWQAVAWLNYPFLVSWVVPTLVITGTATALGLLALRGSWWGLGLSVAMLVLVGWLWSRPAEAPDILTLAATQLEEGRKWIREQQGWEDFKKLYTRITPDVGSLLPDLRRTAPLVSPPLLLGCAIAAGCTLVVFLIARWRPAVAKVALGVLPVAYAALFLSPGLWALTPLWGRTNVMLPAADASVFEREHRERERRVQDMARNLIPLMRMTTTVVASGGVADSSLLAAADLASGPAVQREQTRLAMGGRGPGAGGAGPGGGRLAGGAFGPGGMGPGGMGPGPIGPGGPPGMGGGAPNPEAAEQQRKQRERMANFLKANHNGERWHLAVNGINAASTLIIEEGLSVMPIGGFGNNPTLGSEPDQVKARLAKMVEDGEIRFFQVTGGGGPGGGRMGGPGGFGGRLGGPGGRPGGNPPNAADAFVGPPLPPELAAGNGAPARRPADGNAVARPGPGGGNAPPMMPGRGNAAVGEWVREQAEKGKAQVVDRKLYTLAVQGPGRAPRGGFGPGMMGGGGGEVYDLRPDLGLKETEE